MHHIGISVCDCQMDLCTHMTLPLMHNCTHTPMNKQLKYPKHPHAVLFLQPSNHHWLCQCGTLHLEKPPLSLSQYSHDEITKLASTSLCITKGSWCHLSKLTSVTLPSLLWSLPKGRHSEVKCVSFVPKTIPAGGASQSPLDRLSLEKIDSSFNSFYFYLNKNYYLTFLCSLLVKVFQEGILLKTTK